MAATATRRPCAPLSHELSYLHKRTKEAMHDTSSDGLTDSSIDSWPPGSERDSPLVVTPDGKALPGYRMMVGGTDGVMQNIFRPLEAKKAAPQGKRLAVKVMPQPMRLVGWRNVKYLTWSRSEDDDEVPVRKNYIRVFAVDPEGKVQALERPAPSLYQHEEEEVYVTTADGVTYPAHSVVLTDLEGQAHVVIRGDEMLTPGMDRRGRGCYDDMPTPSPTFNDYMDKVFVAQPDGTTHLGVCVMVADADGAVRMACRTAEPDMRRYTRGKGRKYLPWHRRYPQLTYTEQEDPAPEYLILKSSDGSELQVYVRVMLGDEEEGCLRPSYCLTMCIRRKKARVHGVAWQQALPLTWTPTKHTRVRKAIAAVDDEQEVLVSDDAGTAYPAIRLLSAGNDGAVHVQWVPFEDMPMEYAHPSDPRTVDRVFIGDAEGRLRNATTVMIARANGEIRVINVPTVEEERVVVEEEPAGFCMCTGGAVPVVGLSRVTPYITWHRQLLLRGPTPSTEELQHKRCRSCRRCQVMEVDPEGVSHIRETVKRPEPEWEGVVLMDSKGVAHLGHQVYQGSPKGFIPVSSED
eukprot:Sspe_Gene.23373::Locus_9081_Transcript_1_1_Confidence_1.000_Length_1837::g.23373::m.23373